MSEMGQSLPKRDVRVTSAYPLRPPLNLGHYPAAPRSTQRAMSDRSHSPRVSSLTTTGKVLPAQGRPAERVVL